VLSASQNQLAWRSNAATMSEHRTYLNIGSNIKPEVHLPKALELLAKHVCIQAVSSAWESRAVGSGAPNFLNACALFASPLEPAGIKEELIQPIETALDRKRGAEKYAPRTIDLDVIMFDGNPLRLEQWNLAYIVVPMAELDPNLEHPITHEKISEVADRIRLQTWIVPRPEILRHYSQGRSKS